METNGETNNANEYKMIKNSNWPEADQLVIYKRGWRVELGATEKQPQVNCQSGTWSRDLRISKPVPQPLGHAASTLWSGATRQNLRKFSSSSKGLPKILSRGQTVRSFWSHKEVATPVTLRVFSNVADSEIMLSMLCALNATLRVFISPQHCTVFFGLVLSLPWCCKQFWEYMISRICLLPPRPFLSQPCVLYTFRTGKTKESLNLALAPMVFATH